MTRVAWQDVLRVLPRDDQRSAVVVALADSGFSADSFASQTRARVVVADALTRIEDALEMAARDRRRAGLDTERASIRAIRRRLEVGAFP